MIRFYDEAPLLKALDAAVDAARLAGPVPVKTDVCPECDGSGQITLTRLFGRYVEAPYRRTDCTACSGTGEVAADAVAHCTDCGGVCWADQACTHQLGTLCPDHAPACVECTGVRGDQ